MHSMSPRTAALLAAAWALAFAAVSAYWAAGGMAGVHTVARSLADQAAARDPGFVALLWITVAAKLMLAALALGLRHPRAARPVRAAGWLAGGLLTLYGAVGLIGFGLMAIGARDVPADVGHSAVAWYVLLWEPLWLLGGLLFLAATRLGYGRLRARSPRRSITEAV